MKATDDNLAKVLAAIGEHHATDSTDVIIVSDHGFSTIQRQIELPSILKKAGFNADTELKSNPAAGDVLVVGGGGSVLFYVVKHDAATIRRLIEFLQQTDYAAVLFSREKIEGTFPMAQAGIDTPDVPDVVMAFRWNDQPNQFGVHGMIDADWQRGPGHATHATLSRFDMHNTMIAAGPDFRHGQADDLPTGNVDVAPTVLRILKLTPSMPMDGRVLTEALANEGEAPASPESQTIEASRQFPSGNWQQSLRTSRVGSTVYLDEGNGSFTPAK